MGLNHAKKEIEFFLIGKHFKGAEDENRITKRLERACEAILKDLSVAINTRCAIENCTGYEIAIEKRCNEFDVSVSKVKRILKGEL
jgi:hypothetical protein